MEYLIFSPQFRSDAIDARHRMSLRGAVERFDFRTF